jgi:hypothetical protein
LVGLIEALKCDPGKPLNSFQVGELTSYKQSQVYKIPVSVFTPFVCTDAKNNVTTMLGIKSSSEPSFSLKKFPPG